GKEVAGGDPYEDADRNPKGQIAFEDGHDVYPTLEHLVVVPSTAPMPSSLEFSAIRSMLAIGRLMKAPMRLRRRRRASSKAARCLNSGPSTAAGSSMPQCAVSG